MSFSPTHRIRMPLSVLVTVPFRLPMKDNVSDVNCTMRTLEQDTLVRAVGLVSAVQYDTFLEVIILLEDGSIVSRVMTGSEIDHHFEDLTLEVPDTNSERPDL